ncbi:MAG: HD domain-containing protein, partial [Syntrophorhabdales bacterium]
HTPYDVEELFKGLLKDAEGMKNPWLKKLVLKVLSEPQLVTRYKRAPAAKVMHHAYIGGLLEHVAGLCGLAKQIAAHYPELDVDLLLTAAMLHDVGKLDELCFERAVSYTTEGQLLGHISPRHLRERRLQEGRPESAACKEGARTAPCFPIL